MTERLTADAVVKYVSDARWRLVTADLTPPARSKRSRRQWHALAAAAPVLDSVANLNGQQLSLAIYRQIDHLYTMDEVLAAREHGDWLIAMVKELIRRAQTGELDARIAVEGMRAQFETKARTEQKAPVAA